jgi:hypothetical protein
MICGEGTEWRGCRNTGCERRGGRTGPGGSWEEWYETPCSQCGRLAQERSVLGAPVRVIAEGAPRTFDRVPTFAEIVQDAEAFATSLYEEALDMERVRVSGGSALMSFQEIVMRAQQFAEARYNAAISASTIVVDADESA